MIRSTAALCALALLSPVASVRAQTMTRDRASGDYTITYQIGESSYQIVVPSADRISPRFALTAIRSEHGSWIYEYTLTNRDQPPALPGRGLLTLYFECPRGSGAPNEDVEQPTSWRLRVYERIEGGASCQFDAGLRGILDPRESAIGLRIRAHALPGFSTVRAVGVSEGGVNRTGDDTPDSVFTLMGYAASKGVELIAITPAHNPDTLPGPITVIQLMRADLRRMCGPLLWIRDQPTCNVLGARLRTAEETLYEDDNDASNAAMREFTTELQVRRRRQVPEAAYLMFAAMREYLLSNM